MGLARLLGAAVAVVLACAGPAQAATLEEGRYVAAAGELNRLTLTHADGWFHYSDAGAFVQVRGEGCEPTGPQSGRCREDAVRHDVRFDSGHTSLPRPSADLGDLDDAADVAIPRVEAARWGVALAGGPGADELDVAAPGAQIHGDREHWEPSADDGADRVAFDGGVVQRPNTDIWTQRATTAVVRAGGGDDVVAVTGVYNRLYGDTGNDVLVGDSLNPPPKDERCKAFLLEGCVQDVPGQNCWGQALGAISDEVEGGAGDDRIYGGSGEDRLFGQEGRDVVEGGAHCDIVAGDFASQKRFDYYFSADAQAGGDADVLDGGDEADTLVGSVGDDTIRGGDGFDMLSGDAGADTIDGGGGTDRTSYVDRRGPIVATLDAVADDGEPGEGDRLGPDIEEVHGTHAADRMVGSPGPNTFRAGDGDDVLVGGGGADHLSGEGGSDRIHALEGEPAVAHHPLPGIPVAGLTAHYDDSVGCDDERPPPSPLPPHLPPPPPPYDPGEPGASDTVLADSTDRVQPAGTAPSLGCEVVLHSETPVTVDPETTSSIPVPAYCDAGERGARCKATATVVAASGGRIGGTRFKPPKRWQALGKRAYEAKFGGKRRRVKVPVSRSAARKARGGRPVKAYVAYRYAKPKR